jgi:hypothetical protein
MTIELSAHAPTSFIEANGVTYAYRRLGQPSGVPLVFLQNFTGTMDSWDPVVVDGFAQAGPVILFDNQGVSRSGGTTPDTVAAMANDTVAFITALGLTQVDLLGFSLGGYADSKNHSFSGMNFQTLPRFGTEGSEVHILSPRPPNTREIPMTGPSKVGGPCSLYGHRWGKSGDTSANGAR